MAERRPYPADLSDARWALIEPTLTTWQQARLAKRATDTPATTDLRDVVNALLYLNHTGISWRYILHDFPPHGTVYYYYAKWRDEGVFAQLNLELTGLARAKAVHPTTTKAWVDQGFKNKFVEHAATLGVDAEVVTRNPGTRGFHVLKRRWAVERTIGWLMLHRRLARDYETLTMSSEAMIHLAMIDNVSKRITDETTPTWMETY